MIDGKDKKKQQKNHKGEEGKRTDLTKDWVYFKQETRFFISKFCDYKYMKRNGKS